MLSIYYKMNRRLLNKHGKSKNNVKISILNKDTSDVDPQPIVKTEPVVKKSWMWRILGWFTVKFVQFVKWVWSYPKRFIKWLAAMILMWLLSFLPFKLPNLPFLPLPVQQSKPQENKKEEKKEDPKKEQSTPTDQTKTNVVTTTVTNTVTQTNMVTQTNYVTETKYITNFVVQPIVVTNTVIKEVPVVVTNVLVIKNGISDTSTNGAKNKVMNGPAFYFTDDFNTLLQNQQQNPVRGQRVN